MNPKCLTRIVMISFAGWAAMASGMPSGAKQTPKASPPPATTEARASAVDLKALSAKIEAIVPAGETREYVNCQFRAAL